MDDIRLDPIGVIRTPHNDPSRTPIQPVYATGVAGRAELLPEYAEGLDDLDGFSHVWLVYVFHRAGAPRLRVKPYLQDVERGVFATRAPCRPNPVGMSLVRLLRREGNVLHVEDVDILDGSPLLDVKPFIPRFDVREGARAGWQEEVDEQTARRKGARLEAAAEAKEGEGGG